MQQIDLSSLFASMTRLAEVGRLLGVSLPLGAKRDLQAEAGCQPDLLDGGLSRFELERRVLVAAGLPRSGGVVKNARTGRLRGWWTPGCAGSTICSSAIQPRVHAGRMHP